MVFVAWLPLSVMSVSARKTLALHERGRSREKNLWLRRSCQRPSAAEAKRTIPSAAREKTSGTQGKIEQAEAKVILFFAKFRANWLQN